WGERRGPLRRPRAGGHPPRRDTPRGSPTLIEARHRHHPTLVEARGQPKPTLAEARVRAAGEPRSHQRGDHMTRPYTTLSCAVSLDGYLDDASPQRLMLSNDVDLDRVDQVRAESDAILVGACTLRKDNP